MLSEPNDVKQIFISTPCRDDSHLSPNPDGSFGCILLRASQTIECLILLFPSAVHRYLLGELWSRDLHPDAVCAHGVVAGRWRSDAGAPASALWGHGREGRCAQSLNPTVLSTQSVEFSPGQLPLFCQLNFGTISGWSTLTAGNFAFWQLPLPAYNIYLFYTHTALSSPKRASHGHRHWCYVLKHFHPQWGQTLNLSTLPCGNVQEKVQSLSPLHLFSLSLSVSLSALRVRFFKARIALFGKYWQL